jgi:SAM-dependent methyltransferase
MEGLRNRRLDDLVLLAKMPRTNDVSHFLACDRKPVDDLASRLARRVAEALRARRCPPDRAFDRFLPDELRVVSNQYWTPLAVATRTAEWLDDLDVRTVVDIGSGAGKLCVAAALACRGHFTGLERRSRLVASARALARVFNIDDRVNFIEGAFGDIATPVADAYYLYNPFGEYRFGSREYFDPGEELGDKHRARDVAAVEDLLQRAPIGTCVVTYNGFGGRVPATYQQIRVDEEMPSTLRLWRKNRRTGFTRKPRPAPPSLT